MPDRLEPLFILNLLAEGRKSQHATKISRRRLLGFVEYVSNFVNKGVFATFVNLKGACVITPKSLGTQSILYFWGQRLLGVADVAN